jgi:subtilisin-like proprotein convertase family protein
MYWLRYGGKTGKKISLSLSDDLIVTRTRESRSLEFNREGGSARNISRTYDALNTNALASLFGKSPQGTWTLRVQDKARHDVGKIERFSVELDF